MTPGRRVHLGKQVVEERRLVVLVLRRPTAVINPCIGQRLIRRRQRQSAIGTDAPNRVPVPPALEVDNLTGLGPVSPELGDQLVAIQRTSPATCSADPRQRVADQQINDARATETGLE